MDKSVRDYFASANSGRGFANYFNNIFGTLKNHYIIKGGPGTGKSSLMKKVAQAAIDKGMSVELYHCSSDPNSLDGIIINDLSIGITDGTAPHVIDPKYPGVVEEIIDLGEFWDSSILKQSADSIRDLTDRKSLLFGNVYLNLEALLKIDLMIDTLTTASIKTQKAKKAVARIAEKIYVEQGDPKIRLTEGITMEGYQTYYPFEKEAESIFYIRDKYNIAYVIFDMLFDHFKNNDITVSYNPLNTEKINTLYLPTCKTLFTTAPTDNATVINTERFIDKEIYKTDKQHIVKASKAKRLLFENTYSLLGEIRDLHFSLERIYGNAMDFERKEACQEKLISKIFS